MKIRKAVTLLITLGVAATAVAVAGLATAADAKPRPGPTITTKYYRSLTPPPVVIDATPEAAGAAVYAINLWNAYTSTDILCAADNDGNCAHITCPDMNNCLVLRMGSLGLTGPDATLRSFGPRKALITINRDGPLFRDGWGNYTPWQRGMMLSYWVGRFIGLPTNTTHCLSAMDVNFWQCPPKRPDEPYLTSAEASQAAAW